ESVHMRRLAASVIIAGLGTQRLFPELIDLLIQRRALALVILAEDFGLLLGTTAFEGRALLFRLEPPFRLFERGLMLRLRGGNLRPLTEGRAFQLQLVVQGVQPLLSLTAIGGAAFLFLAELPGRFFERGLMLLLKRRALGFHAALRFLHGH